jgi:hypothetical protein
MAQSTNTSRTKPNGETATARSSDLEQIAAYCRAANNLTVRQFYVLDNPLLRELLEGARRNPWPRASPSPESTEVRRRAKAATAAISGSS